MARTGITQADVDRACDRIVARGERPTTERIRAELGTGSPNTIVRLLDGWWRQLAERLTAAQGRADLPQAPPALAQQFSQLWETALAAAKTEADAGLAKDREELAIAAEALARQTEELQAQVQAAENQAQAALQAQTAADTRLADAHALIGQQAHQLDDLVQQRDAVQARCDRLEAELRELSKRSEQQEAAAAVALEAERAHARGVEERAHLEVDRLRQELKSQRAGEQLLRQGLEEAQHALATAQQDAAAQRARADTLTAQLTRSAAPAARKPAASRRKAGTPTTKTPRSRKAVGQV